MKSENNRLPDARLGIPLQIRIASVDAEPINIHIKNREISWQNPEQYPPRAFLGNDHEGHLKNSHCALYPDV